MTNISSLKAKKLQLLMALTALVLATLACQTIIGQPSSGVAPTPIVVTRVVQLPAATQLPPVEGEGLSGIVGSETLIALYEAVNPGVVAIRTLSIETGTGLGSGFVIDKEGHIVTNYHVVENVEELEISFSNGFKARGSVIGIDLDSDLAVIKVEAPS